MSRGKLLSVLDIAKELNTGKATIKFLLKRFEKWLPCDFIDGQPMYPSDTLNIMLLIQENIEMGLLPSEVEKQLENLSSPDSGHLLNAVDDSFQNKDFHLSDNGLSILKSLLNEIAAQQKRIAAAHEKRAEAEERKVSAIEKRAAAEEKKADAMNNIAAALQEMNKLRAIDPAAHQIVHQTATVIAADETDQQDLPLKLDDMANNIQDFDTFDETDADLSSLLDEDTLLEEFSAFDQELDDDDPIRDMNGPVQPDDLYSLIEAEPVAQISSFEPDDLSVLISDTGEQTLIKLDDLSALISDAAEQTCDEMDDLSMLLDAESLDNKSKERIADKNLDNLALLIDTEPEQESIYKTVQTDQPELIQDLNALIDPGRDEQDDLSSLIDESSATDDLTRLIEGPVDGPGTLETSSKEEPENIPAIIMDCSPEENLEKYKAAIMKVILELKTQGLTAEETTLRLNTNKVKTLSGKPEWSQKAISQIYKFITSVK